MADNDLINDELERAYRLYSERTRQCGRGLYVLIVAGLAIFVLLVVPFLTFRDKLAAVQAEEVRLAAELQQARDLVADTDTSMKTLRDLAYSVGESLATLTEAQLYVEMYREAEDHADELEALRQSYARTEDEAMLAWVRGEAKQPPQERIDTSRHLYNLARDPCYWESGEPRVTCRLCARLMEENETVSRRIERLPAVGAELADPVMSDLDGSVERACDWLTRGEAHWERGERPAGFSRHDLRDWFHQDLVIYRDRVLTFENDLRQEMVERGLEVEHIERARAAATERLAVLEAQLDRIAGFDRLGTPVGDLPVGLGQIVLLFPVVLAFGFLVVANSHARAARTQRAFVRLCRKRDKAGEVMDDEHLAAVAPLWLDPHEPLGARLAKWAILLTPLALTLANLLLIWRTEALTAQLPEDSAIPPAAYVVLYAITLAVFAGTLRHIWRAGRPDAAEPEADHPEAGPDTPAAPS